MFFCITYSGLKKLQAAAGQPKTSDRSAFGLLLQWTLCKGQSALNNLFMVVSMNQYVVQTHSGTHSVDVCIPTNSFFSGNIPNTSKRKKRKNIQTPFHISLAAQPSRRRSGNGVWSRASFSASPLAARREHNILLGLSILCPRARQEWTGYPPPPSRPVS